MIWFILTLCLIAVMAIVLWPFLKASPVTASTDWTRASLKAALAAVDKDEARGLLSFETANQQRAEIAAKAKAAFEDDTDLKPSSVQASSQASPHASRPRLGFILAALSLALAPILLFGAYLFLGTPDPASAEKLAAKALITQQAAAQLEAQNANGEVNVDDAIKALEGRLNEAPNDSRAWAALGDLKIRAGDFIGAEAAFVQAASLPNENTQEKAQIWLLLAMTRRTQGRELNDPSVVEALQKSLALDANSPAAILLQRIEDEGADTP